MADRVLVVGGGLAGIAAALCLADGGAEVTLLEGRPRLGGAAFSFRRDELSVDNGQHVFLRCCDDYRWLLRRIGAVDDVVLQDRLDIPVLRADGRRARLRRPRGVPAPAHLGRSLATYALLGPADRMRAVQGALALRRLDPDDPSLDSRTLGAFLRSHGQNDATIAALWGIVATATLNLDPDQASLALAAKVFRTGLLDHAPAADIGYAAVPLSDIHSVATARALQRAGVQVELRQRVEEVDPDGSVTSRGQGQPRQWRADAVVLAVPPRDAFAICPQLERTPAAVARELGTSPIVNVHVIYNRQITDLPFAAAVDSPVQWFFDRTASSGLTRTHPRAQYLAVTVSAAEGVIDAPARELAERFTDDLAQLLPAAGRAHVLDAFVTRERHATFRQAAGSAAMRPASDVGLERIRLAGAWTATGWPDTMESAVRSGIAAAHAIQQRRMSEPVSVPA